MHGELQATQLMALACALFFPKWGPNPAPGMIWHRGPSVV